jgi:hypothetical protein
MTPLGDGGRDVRTRAAIEAASEAQVRARRNWLIGEWAAALMGLEDAQAYARAVSRSPAETPPDEDVARKVARDLGDSGLAGHVGEVPGKMDEFLAIARAQLGDDHS